MAARSIFIAGHRGLAGSAILRRYQRDPRWTTIVRARQELDLTDAAAVMRFFEEARPDAVILAAARVGGILANSRYPVEFLLENVQIQNNVLAAAHRCTVERLLFLGSSCIYPKHTPQPMSEDALMTGKLEPTNEAYAIAKIAGIALARAYRQQYGRRYTSALPCNLYGPNDNFSPEDSHVLPALIRRFHEAKRARLPSVALWGTGTPRREFLHADDFADACHFVLATYDEEGPINIGVGADVPIRELAALVARVVGYEGGIQWDHTKPDGTPRKLLDTRRLTALGWRSRIGLEEGVRLTYDWFVDNQRSLRGGPPRGP